jgi:hypothetical protein
MQSECQFMDFRNTIRTEKKQRIIFSWQYPFMLFCYHAQHEGVSTRWISSQWPLLKHTSCNVRTEAWSGSMALCLLSFIHLSTLPYLVWWPSCQPASAKKWLGRIHRCAGLGITEAMQNDQMCAMEALLAFFHLT